MTDAKRSALEGMLTKNRAAVDALKESLVAKEDALTDAGVANAKRVVDTRQKLTDLRAEIAVLKELQEAGIATEEDQKRIPDLEMQLEGIVGAGTQADARWQNRVARHQNETAVLREEIGDLERKGEMLQKRLEELSTVAVSAAPPEPSS